ncbi:MAG: molybdenum cofactor guanylyltransferase MobA [Wenzhouxiangellaceae bacterium]|nr:molybdenum cofactor guanylyltransferase MobA [Wenzhouxiangellaceae bacterium]
MDEPTPATASITGAVLAGGRATRMGGIDKGLVEVGGKSLVERTLVALKPQVGPLMINANRSVEIYAGFGVPVIADRLDDFQGPLAGLQAILTAATTPYVLTVPCDAPRIPSDLATRLGRALIDADAEIAVVQAGGRLQSLHALFRRDLLDDLSSTLRAGRRKPDAWYATRALVKVSFEDCSDAFVNINTPQQRDALAAELGDAGYGTGN